MDCKKPVVLGAHAQFCNIAQGNFQLDLSRLVVSNNDIILCQQKNSGCSLKRVNLVKKGNLFENNKILKIEKLFQTEDYAVKTEENRSLYGIGFCMYLFLKQTLSLTKVIKLGPTQTVGIIWCEMVCFCSVFPST